MLYQVISLSVIKQRFLHRRRKLDNRRLLVKHKYLKFRRAQCIRSPTVLFSRIYVTENLPFALQALLAPLAFRVF